MTVLRTVLLLGLVVGAMSAQMKQKLAQQADKIQLAQQTDCNVPIVSLAPL